MSLNFGMRCSTVVPNKPPLTEQNLPDQKGKVFLVTGASGGLGKLLVDILYRHNGKVYLAARSQSKTEEVIQEIKSAHPSSTGELHFLHLELDDLSTVKPAANRFLEKEGHLDVLWNNAGVMIPPEGSKTKQGYELQYGVNNIAHFLLTLLLRPALEAAAASAPKNSVRVVWVASSAADAAPNPAVDLTNMDYHREEGAWMKYSRSKAASVIHSAEFARRTKGTGIISLVSGLPLIEPSDRDQALNPGNFVTNLQQNMSKMELAMFKLISSDPINGAYTELFAGLSDTITEENNGGWVSPFGKVENIRKDFVEPELGSKFWDWTVEQVKPYM
ncbi:short-chain alcohol dehydrogenase [Fusarium oxysporum]|nr:short-chain alcohol dehydrogenase [Fusarium oxysporum]KAJ4076598.1 short-chain alcohol dehydrogenase [Fusarium oxysporum]